MVMRLLCLIKGIKLMCKIKRQGYLALCLTMTGWIITGWKRAHLPEFPAINSLETLFVTRFLKFWTDIHLAML